jgi:hypothetical protein
LVFDRRDALPTLLALVGTCRAMRSLVGGLTFVVERMLHWLHVLSVERDELMRDSPTATKFMIELEDRIVAEIHIDRRIEWHNHQFCNIEHFETMRRFARNVYDRAALVRMLTTARDAENFAAAFGRSDPAQLQSIPISWNIITAEYRNPTVAGGAVARRVARFCPNVAPSVKRAIESGDWPEGGTDVFYDASEVSTVHRGVTSTLNTIEELAKAAEGPIRTRVHRGAAMRAVVEFRLSGDEAAQTITFAPATCNARLLESFDLTCCQFQTVSKCGLRPVLRCTPGAVYAIMTGRAYALHGGASARTCETRTRERAEKYARRGFTVDATRPLGHLSIGGVENAPVWNTATCFTAEWNAMCPTCTSPHGHPERPWTGYDYVKSDQDGMNYMRRSLGQLIAPICLVADEMVATRHGDDQ